MKIYLKTSKKQSESLSPKLFQISFLIALIGVAISMWGASWDITSHLLRIQETFFTPSHTILYLGVGISLIAALMSLTLIKKREARKFSFTFGSKLIIIGGILQLFAGPSDFYWHELFGVDGLLSPTHLALALGMMVTSVGSTIGITRVRFHKDVSDIFVKISLPLSFGIFWFSVMWLVFFFVLPISGGEFHNFNPNPFFALVLSLTVIPFVFSILFWSISKTLNTFGAASLSALMFVTMNVTSNILTSEKLLIYLPMFVAPIASAIISDYILSKRLRSKLITKHSEKVAGSILGSTFFIFCFPMLSMTFLNFYVFNDIFVYDVLPNASDTIYQIWGMTIIPGTISGMLGMMFAEKKLKLSS